MSLTVGISYSPYHFHFFNTTKREAQTYFQFSSVREEKRMMWRAACDLSITRYSHPRSTFEFSVVLLSKHVYFRHTLKSREGEQANSENSIYKGTFQRALNAYLQYEILVPTCLSALLRDVLYIVRVQSHLQWIGANLFTRHLSRLPLIISPFAPFRIINQTCDNRERLGKEGTLWSAERH